MGGSAIAVNYIGADMIEVAMGWLPRAAPRIATDRMHRCNVKRNIVVTSNNDIGTYLAHNASVFHFAAAKVLMKLMG